MLHPRRSAQDVLRCEFCVTAPVQSHCELCNVSLCKACVAEHISDSSKRHNVVPFLQYVQRNSTPNYAKCQQHAEKDCELHCETCDISVCSTCALFGNHRGHDISELSAKTKSLQKDLEELETRIYPRYKEMVSDVQIEKAHLETNYGKLTAAADQQGEILHREVTAIVNQRKSAIQEMKNKHLSTLDKNTDEIAEKFTELKQIIAELKSILKSNDTSLISSFKSRISEFRTLPPRVRFTLSRFSPGKINKDQLNEMFGSLSSLSINTEYGETIKSPEAVSYPPAKPIKPLEAVSSPPVKSLHQEPRFTATINTGYELLNSVSCLGEDQVWTRGENEIMKLLNFQGKLLTSIQTKSGNAPQDIAVTRSGYLVYTDPDNRTVNLVRNKQIHPVITLQGWEPRYICSTASDDLMVTMLSDDREQSKVVRYFNSTETQTIQFNDEACPLYSSGLSCDYKYICENRNLDICVADYTGRAVVVVNQSGKLRFRYNGHPSNTKESFRPIGITTDSQSHILTADCKNDCIHILDQDGQFLRYIRNLRNPFGLCVDIRDNLFVVEHHTAKVKKIQYL